MMNPSEEIGGINGICRVCGKHGEGQEFQSWVKDTFTNYDALVPGDIICAGCLFWFDQHSVCLQKIIDKDKPQKMQNYSHFIVDGTWIPLSKGNKKGMKELLVSAPFPELAAIADSGQKHIAFRARRNPPGQISGWVQFEEQAIWVDPPKLISLLAIIEELYIVFNKAEIGSGDYSPNRIRDFGVDRWLVLEDIIKIQRETPLFKLALFLAQRSDEDERSNSGIATNDNDPTQIYLGGSAGRLQEPVSDDDLGTVRERDSSGSIYKQPAEIYQYNLFKTES